jgi:L-seryl-tRNA(Ser) seleniumtransferase
MGIQAVKQTIFKQLRVTPVINACGIYTDLGGSILSPAVWSAMAEINSSFVNMMDLLDKSGELIAGMLGAESARVTPGASAAIALGTAACMTGMDGTGWERLPDTAGMKNEVIIQNRHRYKYDRCARIAGAQLVVVGDDNGTTSDQLVKAIGARTAAILFPAHLDKTPGTMSLHQVRQLAQQYGIPILVDAAYLNYPVDVMKTFTAAGADLVCFSSKYFGGPNAGGFICGRKDLIDAVAGVDFTRFESGKYRTFGRPFKLDRQIIVGVVVALQEWWHMDHQARWEGYARKVQTMVGALRGVPEIALAPSYFTMDERLLPQPVNCLAIDFDSCSGKTAQQVYTKLAEGDPSIATVLLDHKLIIAVDTLLDGQEQIIVERLKLALQSSEQGPKR